MRTLVTVVLGMVLLWGCAPRDEAAVAAGPGDRKVGVLLANHGSRQQSWRDMLLEVETAVGDQILALPDVKGVKTAFMEYSEPSIATRLKEFDAEGYDEIIVVPIFVTVGGHTNQDIPNLIGVKNDPGILESLRRENIETYRPRAKVTLTRTLDATDFLKANILRRTRARLAGQDGRDFGVTLAAYGDDKFNQQWEALMAEVGRYLMAEVGIDTINYAWSGHLVNYSIEPTRKAVNDILAKKKKDIVVSVYVAYDKKFQSEVIGGGIAASDRPGDVLYAERESILPDADLNAWIVQSVRDAVGDARLAASPQ
jgi:hypothetical protein